MNILLCLQIAQSLLALYLILLCANLIKSSIGLKINMLVLLLVTIMIIPPIGRNYISAVTINNI